MLIHFKIAEVPWLLLDLFDLDEEDSFGTWFSGANLLCTVNHIVREQRAPVSVEIEIED